MRRATGGPRSSFYSGRRGCELVGSGLMKNFSTLRTGESAGPTFHRSQPPAARSSPADPPRRHAGHQRVGGDIAIDHRPGGDKRVAPDAHAADDGAVGPERRAALDVDRL